MEWAGALNIECTISARFAEGALKGRQRGKWEEGEGIEKGGQTGGQRKGVIFSDKQKKILEILKKKPRISRKELAEELNINTSAIQKHLLKLKEAGYIKRIGPDFGGHWEIVSINP